MQILFQLCPVFKEKKQLGAIVIIISDTQPTYAVFLTPLQIRKNRSLQNTGTKYFL